MTKVITLASNIEELKAKGLESKGHEISVAVKIEDLTKDNPPLYAYRYGMIYDPKENFTPNIPSNHKLPDEDKSHHRNEYFRMLPEAKIQLERIKSNFKAGENNADLEMLQSQVNTARRIIDQKETRINEQSAQIAELSAKVQSASNSQAGQMQELLDKQLQAIKEMQAIQNNRIEIKIGDKAPKIIEKAIHENFTTILELLADKQAVYCYGPAGTGKSELAKQLAEALELDFHPASTITQEFKLTGFIDGNGKYHETNFYRAMKYGGLFFLDEMDSCLSEVLVGINGALANGYFDFPHELVYAHPDFRVISAGNTIGRGGDMNYTGRQALDLSTLDRFWGVEVDYSPTIDKAVANNDMELVEFAQELRRASKESDISILLSYRSISRIANFQDKFSLVEIMKMAVIKGVASDDVRMLVRNMNLDSTNKYYKALKKAV